MRLPGFKTSTVPLLLSLIPLVTAGAHAQEVTATLEGIVSDPAGAPLGNAALTLTNRTMGVPAANARTDDEGRFAFRQLAPGAAHDLLVEKSGYVATEIGPIVFRSGRTTFLEVTLDEGPSPGRRAEVAPKTRALDAGLTKDAYTYDRSLIAGLPVIGRRYQTVMTLAPGVTDGDADGRPNVRGARETVLHYRLDGTNISDPATGGFGQNVNLESIAEIELIPSGAGAEYGRAGGGFTTILTRSGGDAFEGSVRLFYRGDPFDDEDWKPDMLSRASGVASRSRALNAFLSLGGPLSPGRLWYFLSLQYIDELDRTSLRTGSLSRTAQGWNLFGKLTSQMTSRQKLAFQLSADPRDFEGLFSDLNTSSESAALLEQGGTNLGLRWSWSATSRLFVEGLVSRFDSGIAITPESDLFHEISIGSTLDPSTTPPGMQALYPVRECSTDGTVSGFIPNCDPTLGTTSIYQVNLLTGRTTGPFPSRRDDSRTRTALRGDVTLAVDDAWGEHELRAGVEFTREELEDAPVDNPFLINAYEPCPYCRDANGNPIPNAVTGCQVLSVPTPTSADVRIEGLSTSVYLSDAWKPLPNLTLRLGVRLDREKVDTPGLTHFDPLEERREYVAIADALCADGLRVAAAGNAGPSDTATAVCGAIRPPGQPPNLLIYTMDADTPPEVRRFDRNGDGLFEVGTDGPVWLDAFTTFLDRRDTEFEISNANLSPRLGVAWDPWSDGKTRFFSTWGRYYDRLALAAAAGEMNPAFLDYTFVPDPTAQMFLPLQPSARITAVSVQQVDRDLKTPFTDEFTLGAERELAPEWSAKILYVQRLAWDLLQDSDVNHITCVGHEEAFGFAPETICRGPLDPNGNPTLDEDLFGHADKSPNGAIDLYALNVHFNRVLRVVNLNSSKYRAVSLVLERRLHRNWQMQASYTYSRATGQAEIFNSSVGDDPATRGEEDGYLGYDQRHRVVIAAVGHLPRAVELGGRITWESGTPYTVEDLILDQDDQGNTSVRVLYPTGLRNDQRNGGRWIVDARIAKRFLIGEVGILAEIAVNDLLDGDDVSLSAFRSENADGAQLVPAPSGYYGPGRTWEVGLTFSF